MAVLGLSGPSLFKMKECCVLDVYCAALPGKGGGQEPPFTASGAGSISRNLPTRSFNEALQKRPASIAVCVFIILKASFLLAVACFKRWSLLSEGSRWR